MNQHEDSPRDTLEAVRCCDAFHAVDAATPVFRLPTRVRFRVGAVDHELALELTDVRHVARCALPGAPSQAIFDPGQVLLAQVKVDKAEPLWIAELADAALAIDRAAAATYGVRTPPGRRRHTRAPSVDSVVGS